MDESVTNIGNVFSMYLTYVLSFSFTYFTDIGVRLLHKICMVAKLIKTKAVLDYFIFRMIRRPLSPEMSRFKGSF